MLVKYKYPEIISELRKNAESQQHLANYLEIDITTLRKKLSGKTQWNIGEIDKLCEHFVKDYYELFKRED